MRHSTKIFWLSGMTIDLRGKSNYTLSSCMDAKLHLYLSALFDICFSNCSKRAPHLYIKRDVCYQGVNVMQVV